MSLKSKYAPTLNALCDMQQSPAYAVRRQVLADAGQAIVSLEAQRDELLAALGDLRAAFKIAAGDQSPFAKRALATSDEIIAKFEVQS